MSLFRRLRAIVAGLPLAARAGEPADDGAAATAAVNGDGTWPTFGAMFRHASYEILDSSRVQGRGAQGPDRQRCVLDLGRDAQSLPVEKRRGRARASFMGRGEARAASTDLVAEYERLTQ